MLAFALAKISGAAQLEPAAIVIADIDAVGLRQAAQRGLEQTDRAADFAAFVVVGEERARRQDTDDGVEFRNLRFQLHQRFGARRIHIGGGRRLRRGMEHHQLDRDQAQRERGDQSRHRKGYRHSKVKPRFPRRFRGVQ